MPPDPTLEGLDRPDWVLHLPPSPVNALTVTIDDFRQDDGIDDEFTSLGPALATLRETLNDPRIRSDGRRLEIKSVDASFASLQNPADLERSLIKPLGGDRKVRLPKTWLKVIESGFTYQSTTTDDDASDEARDIQRFLAQHPNAALEAEEQGLSQWLTAGDSGFQWNRQALSHGLTELKLASCRLTADSIPALVSLIEGNGTLRDLNLANNNLLHEPGPAALLARSLRSSVVAELILSSNPVDDEAASLHAFLSNLNSTCLHTLRLSHILSEDHSPRWGLNDSEDEDLEEEEEEEWESEAQLSMQARQAQKENQAQLALAAFIQRSIPSRQGSQHSAAGDELAPCFCGCPNLSSITWNGNDDSRREGDAEVQDLNSAALDIAVVGYLAHVKPSFDLAVSFGRLRPFDAAMQRRQVLDAMRRCELHDRSIMPHGSLRWQALGPRALDTDQLIRLGDSPEMQDMLRSVQIARQNVLRATTQDASSAGEELRQLDLEAAVDRDSVEFRRAIRAVSSMITEAGVDFTGLEPAHHLEAYASLATWRFNLVNFHSIWLDILQQQVQRSAFVVLAAARAVACQVEPLAPTLEKMLPGWLRLPSEIRNLCFRFLDEIHVDGYGDLGVGHALSRSQMQAVLSFASDRRTIGYGRINEVLLASKRLADEAAIEAHQPTPEAEENRTDIQNITPLADIFAAPRWSWKKAAERCMPQDWVTQVAWAKQPVSMDGPGSKPGFELPAEALAFLSVTDCRAFRNA